MNKRLTPILILTSALWLFGLSAKAQTIGGSVYGGGNKAAVTGTVSVKISAGEVKQNVFGGGNEEGIKNTSTTSNDGTATITIEGGIIGSHTTDPNTYGIYGGCNTAGTVESDVQVNIKGGTLGRAGNDSYRLKGIYGGGLGQNTNTSGNVEVIIGENSNPAIYGDVYGGSALGKVNGTSVNTDLHTTVTLKNGSVYGDIYGGGLGQLTGTGGAIQAMVYSPVTVTVEGGSVSTYTAGTETKGGNVFGCNNLNGAPQSTAQVDITGGMVSANVYGGGNQAAYSFTSTDATPHSPLVNVKNGTITGSVFGGGLGATAKVLSNPKVTVGDGTSGYTARVNGSVYGGGSAAEVGSSTAPLATNNTKVLFQTNASAAKVFGGGMEAGVTGTATVTMSAGSVSTGIYGGCDSEGTVVGSIIVDVTGGTIGSADANANIHGGGLGNPTTTSGNVTVTFGSQSDTHSQTPKLYGDIYGGSGYGSVNSSSSTTTVSVLNGEISGNVYGGGLGDKESIATGHHDYYASVKGEVIVNIGGPASRDLNPENDTNIGEAIIGGSVYGCNNTNGSPEGDVTVNIYRTHRGATDEVTYMPSSQQSPAATYAIANVFGGGNEADYEPVTNGKKSRVLIHGCYNTIRRVFGGGNAAASGTTSHNVQVVTDINGGRFLEVYGGGNGERGANYSADIYGDVSLGIHGGNVAQFFVGSNQHGTISGQSSVVVNNTGGCESTEVEEFFCGGNYADFVGNIDATITCDQGMHVRNLYGGCNQANVVPKGNPGEPGYEPGNVHLRVYGGTFENVYGGSKGTTDTPANIAGDVTLDIFGGTIDTIFGGSNINGNVFGKITVNVLDLGGSCALTAHNVYGGGRNAAYTPTSDEALAGNYPEVNIINATISKKTITDPNTQEVSYWGGKVFGGGFGAGAVISSSPKVTIGYVEGMSKPSIASGYSYPSTYTATVDSIVFGGGDLAAVAGSTSVTIQKDDSSNSSALSLFGGGNKASVGGATVNVLGGSVTAGVYGGCNESGTVGGPITTHSFNNEGTLLTTTPTYDGTINVNIKSNLGSSGNGNALAEGIYGGGKGNATQTTGDVTVTIGDGTTPVIYSDVYGGSAFGQVGAGDKLTKVDLKAGTINGTIYGGGKGSDTYSATVSGNTELAINGSVTGGVYGGCNVNGTVAGGATVGINGGTIGHITNGNDVYGAVYGGGLGENTKVKGNVIVNVNGASASITGDVYGGSAQGLVNCNDAGNGVNGSANTQVTLTNGTITGNLYGGGHGLDSKAANVWGPVTVNVNGGSVANVFGCNNAAGAPKSTVQVNVEKSNASGAPALNISQNVYGGGNQAAYTYTCAQDEFSPEVNIKNGAITGNVFGGGLGAPAKVCSNPKVTFGSTTSGYSASAVSVYGGGSAAEVGNSTTSAVNNAEVLVQANGSSTKVFGGGMAAGVTGTTAVTISGGAVTSGVYGGCDSEGTVGSTATVQINGGTIGTENNINGVVYGGGLGENTVVNGSVVVNIGSAVGATPNATIHGDVYGGSAMGLVNCTVNGTTQTPVNNATTGVTLNAGTINGDLYGGGHGLQSKAANVWGDVTVTVNGGSINTFTIENNTYGGQVFGCNNAKGTPKGNVAVHIYGTDHGADPEHNKYPTGITTAAQLATNATTQTYAIAAVYGGGNLASYEPVAEKSTTVHVYNCDNTIKDVYGGGNAANVGTQSIDANTFITIDGGRINRVFGGGNGQTSAANIYGTATTTINAGLIDQIFGGGNKQGTITSTSLNLAKSGSCTDEVFGEVFGGANEAPIAGAVNTTVNCGVGEIGYMYGGSNLAQIGTTTSDASVMLNILGGSYDYVFGGSKGETNHAADIYGTTTLNLYGGTIKNAFGGSNINGNITGKIQVNVLDYGHSPCGLVVNNIYGAGNLTAYTPSNGTDTPEINLINGSVTKNGNNTGNVYGGARGETGYPATVSASPKVNIGYNESMGNYGNENTLLHSLVVNATGYSTPSISSLSASVAGSVYGGGENAASTGSTTVIVQNNSTVSEDVYGGGALADVGGSNVTLDNGTGNNTVRRIFGGGMGNSDKAAQVLGTSQVTITSGKVLGQDFTVGTGTDQITVKGAVFGGCNENGNVSGAITLNANGGNITGNVYGGGLGALTTTGAGVTVTVNGSTMTNDVYGGSALGQVNTNTDNLTKVNLKSGSITGKLYGGGMGQTGSTNVTKGQVNGNVEVLVEGGSVTDVFGCNNYNGAPLGTVKVDVEKGSGDMTINNVYGGGNLAAYSHAAGTYPEVNIKKGTVANVFGGGLGQSAAVTGSPKVTIGSTTNTTVSVTGNVYGGGDQAAVTGSTSVIVQQHASGNTGVTHNVYGGGNQANVSGSTAVSMTGGTVTEDVYGGGALAHVNTNTTVAISGGSTRMVFGGGMGNNSGTAAQVAGTAGVTISDNANISGYNIGTSASPIMAAVFGGCNVNGSVGGAITLNANGGNIGGNVYGGGLGENTTTGAGVTVTINGSSIANDVYGGSALGKVNANTDNLTKVNLKSGTITGKLYGGGMGQTGEGNVAKGRVNGRVEVLVEGGSVTDVFGCNNFNGAPQGTVKVDVVKAANASTFSVANVYGGGNQAAYTYNTGNYPEVNITNGTVGTNVYGGGLGATAVVTGNPKVTVNGGTVTGNVFGGGSEAVVSGATHVIVSSGTAGYVYGGGALANTGATTVDILGGTINYDIFGGGLGDGTHSPLEDGEVHVNIGARRVNGTTVDTIGEAIINGNVYGCNNVAGSPQDSVYVHVWKTYQNGATLFSGDGYAIANVFGGGNQADFTINNKIANVYIHGCDNTIRRVFGGGNNADAWGVATTIDGGRFEYVFGGGNGEGDGHEANIGLGGASLTIMGGNVGQFFGGSNEHGTITGELTVTATSGECGLDIDNFFCGSNQVYIAGDVNTTITCNGSMTVKNLYGGSNLADIGGSVTLTVEGGEYTNVFGGSKGRLADTQAGVEAKAANINGNVTLNLYGGTIENAFGGSDVYGNIGGKITVNVIDDGSMNTATPPVATCPLVLNNVYGGGRDAAYTPTTAGAYPEVNIIHGAVTKKAVEVGGTTTYTGGNVFGGGLGTTAVVTSNPKVTIGYASGYTYPGNATQPSTPKAEVYGNVYGGGEQADVVGSTTVTVQKENTRVYTDVYGGGALANTEGSTVTLTSGMVNDIYGGGLGQTTPTSIAALVTGPVQVTVNGGTVHDVYGANNVNGGPTNTVQVNINSSVSNNVYGGGNQAAFTGSPKVYVNHGTVANVFGGGKGDPDGDGTTAMVTGTPEVTIGDNNSDHAAKVTANVYGGGDAAKVTGNTKVTYNDNNSSSAVAQLFGGGNAAGVTGTTEVNMNLGKVTSGIFGGCNSKGTVGGAISVNIKGGTLGANGATLVEGIYGGGYGKDTETGDDVTVTIGYGGTTPTIYGDVYGGSALGKVSASSKLTKVDFLNGTLNGTLYGGGKGQTGNTPVSAEVKGDVQVAIANGSISGGVYGGCNLNGDVKGDITVDVNGASIGAEGAPASVFGGGYGNNTTTEGNVEVTLDGSSAIVWGDIYGGSAEGNVNKVNNNNTTTVNVLNGTVKRDIYGGGLGTNDHAAAVNGAVIVNIGSDENTGNAILNGNVYGCNNTNGSPQDNVTVNIYKTHREASQETSGTGFAIANVFGGGNQAAYSPTGTQTASVIIHGCSNTIEDVFGGGDAAAVKKAAVEVNGGRFNRVFAGGNGEVTAANIGSGGTSLLVKAGKIHQLFGGSNERGVIEGPITVTLNHDNTTCVEEIDEFFGGSNLAAIGTDANPATLVTTIECGVGNITDVYGGSNAADIIGNVTLNIEGGTITNAYGGSKGVTNGTAANIKDARNNGQPIGTHGKVTLNLKGGTVTNAYGGSNLNGNIEGEIAVNVSDQGSPTCPLKVTDIYGASNLAAYTPNTGRSTNSPAVYVKNVKSHASATNPANTVLGNVYGGGKGSSAIVTSNPLVVVGDSTSTSGNLASVDYHVYGGGNAAAVNGNTKVLMQKGNSKVSKLFGGGAKAGVSGSSITLNNGLVEEGVFGGCDTIGTVTNNTVILLNGGNVGTVDNPAHYGICGGGWGQPTQVEGNVAVTLNGTTAYSDIYGGSFYGDVNTNENNTTVVTLTTGTVHGNVYGGGLGDRETSVFAKVNGKVTVNVNGGTVNGDVFGCNNDYGAPQSTVNVTMDGGTVRSVMGGGNLADYGGTPVISISGGHVLNQVVGGGNAAHVAGSSITISGGNIATSNAENRGVYGGCNASHDVTGNAIVSITGGTIGNNTNASNVFGGGYGKDTRVGNNVEVTVNGTSATIWGDVYGGSALGNVNGNSPDANKHTYVTLTNGTVKGNVYGGGLGHNDTDPELQAAAKVNGAVAVSINGGKVEGNVYGCNNVYGAPHSTVKVDVYSSNGTIANVFGGGNVAGYSGTPDVTIHNCDNSIGYVYGGGNKAGVNGTNVRVYGGDIEYVFGGGNGEDVAANFQMVDGNAVANIYGGTIDHVFGGNNSNGAISGTVTVNVDKQTESGHNSCDMYIGEVYGGGNLAAGNAGTITIGCTGSLVSGANGHIAHPENIGTTLEGVGTVYGGANQAGIGNDIQLDINNGIVNKVFGGNNTSGTISGTIQVNINKTGNCDWYVGEVYGGGNHADYNGTPDVNIINGIVSGNVYGGGNDITDGTKGVVGSDVEMTGGQVLGGVYGGCNLKGTVTGNSLVKIYGGTVGSQDQLEATPRVVAQVFGGGLGANTKVNGNVTVNVNKGDGVATAPIIWGDVYGGSALGSVNTNNENTTTVNILDGTLGTKTTTGTTPNGQTYYNYFGGNVFGGGLGDDTDATKGQVKGKVFVNIGTTPSGRSRDLDPVNDTCIGNATIKGNVYGCNNTNGSPLDDVTVNIYRTHRDATDEINYIPESGDPEPTFAIANVFGGGNRANYTASGKTASVNIFSCYNSIQRVFGGGNAAAAPNVHTNIQGGRFAEVFGGGNGEVSAANITGNVNLEIHGGTVGEFYVGSNQNGSISGTSNVTVDQSSGCEEVNITEFYCGGKYADFVGDINATITCSQDMHVTNLYGGCKEAHVKAGNGGSGNIHLTVVGGTFENVYGGSRGTQTKGADIEGNITLDIFGGTITKAIYGGSNVKGAIGGTITVNVEDKYPNDNCSLEVSTADVYGGGNQADYPGIPDPTGPLYNLPNHAITHTSPYNYPEVNIKNASVKNVFGGGLNATVTGNPQIFIKKGSKVLGNVYGGGNMGEVNGNPRVIVNGKQTN